MRTVRQRFLALIVFGALLLSAGRGGSGEYPASMPTDLQRIRDRGHLIVAQFQGFRPGFFFYDDQKRYPGHKFPENQDDPDGPLAYEYEGHRLIGFDIDLAYRIARALGVDLRIRRDAEDFYAVCWQVVDRKADIGLGKLSVTYERARYVRYTKPYCVLGTGLLVNRLRLQQLDGGGDIENVLSRHHATFGVIPGNSFRVFTQNRYPDATFRDYPNLEEEFRAVVHGEVAAMYHDEFELKRKLRQNPSATLYARLKLTPGQVDELAIATHPEDRHLHGFINTLLSREEIAVTSEDVLDVYFPYGKEAEQAGRAARPGQDGGDGGRVALQAGVGLVLLVLVGGYLMLARWRGPAGGSDDE
jgi:ABC-type amino acid transport substrate-binding protein